MSNEHISEEIPVKLLRAAAGANRPCSKEMRFLAEAVLEVADDDEEEPMSKAPVSLKKGTQ